ncbi:penicillin acylase family protein [Actinokineospora xionganensis]|uniref:penicillin acylase family protein n=1 Tax=Actinokineospora xionganensis TaxID=2684470 RepID=UPI0035E45F3F
MPQAKTVMAYSQSSDPLSPHHNDQTELSSRKEWVTERFCDVDRHTVSVPRLR